MQRIILGKVATHSALVWLVALVELLPGASGQSSPQAQLSLSAYRALGQADLQQNGVNGVGAASLSSPQAVAVDAGGHVYVADTSNHRVLGWTSAAGFHNGDAAALVLGQPTPQTFRPLGIGIKGFAFPWSVAVDPTTGNLYVADLGNSRILRFPQPFANPSVIEPDAVYGQPDFTPRPPNSNGVTAQIMNAPRGIAFDSHGNLWVSDTGNNRVLRFPAAVLSSKSPAADLVVGQPNLQSAAANAGGDISASGFSAPMGLAFDAQNNLYVADFQNARVLKFAAPVTGASAAATVYGQAKFTTGAVPQTPTSSSMKGPAAVALDAKGSLYVAVPNDNRVLVFASGAASGDPAQKVLGQPDFVTVTANTGAFPQASAASLAGASGVSVDSQGDVLIADTGNNRVLSVPSGAVSASRVLGQTGFAGNGPNQIKPGSVNFPYKIAVDYSQAPFAVYVSDTNNNRVLIWKDSAHFRTGDSADLVIGQPDLVTAVPNVDSGGGSGPSKTGLSGPKGIALAADGTLFVADSGNNRALRFPRPVDQTGRITPDVVLGQPDFTTSASAAVSATSMNAPSGIAMGPNGDIFVADSGNNRILEFASRVSTGIGAIRVYGQPDFSSAAKPNSPSAQTLLAPQGLCLDSASNLYVADAGSHRVLVYPNTGAAPSAGLPASTVIGQPDFAAGSPGAGATGLNAPMDLALDSAGNIYISDSGNNRVAVFPSLLALLTTSASAYLAVGQTNISGNTPDWNSTNGLATPEGLSGPAGIFVDRRDTLYVGDAGNNRVVHFLKPVLGVVNAASFGTSVPVGQGAWSTLYGSGLSTGTQLASTSTLPTALAGRELVVNDDLKAPLYYFGPGQVNFVLPYKAPVGTQRIAARVSDTGEYIAGGSVVIAAYSPAFFTHDQNGQGQAAALNQDNTVNSASNPAKLGSVVQLFGTGQGPLTATVADGVPAPANARTVAVPTSDANTCLNQQPSVCVALGGSGGGAVLGEIQYSGLAPGLVGVWQLNVKLPSSGLLGNSVSVVALVGGPNKSNLVTIAVK